MEMVHNRIIQVVMNGIKLHYKLLLFVSFFLIFLYLGVVQVYLVCLGYLYAVEQIRGKKTSLLAAILTCMWGIGLVISRKQHAGDVYLIFSSFFGIISLIVFNTKRTSASDDESLLGDQNNSNGKRKRIQLNTAQLRQDFLQRLETNNNTT
jgi:hypothetical protein